MHVPASPQDAPKGPVGAEEPGSATAGFMRGIAAFAGFAGIGDPERFVALPADWSVGVADVVASTQAIAAGHYRSVNTAGAAVISAVANALGTLDFPFIFAGDGASFAVAAADVPRASQALAATVAWAGAVLDLRLRAAIVPVAAIRAEGLDVQVARFAASADATYAMFAGGGLAWAERQLKAGAIALPPAGADARPDLGGLSCRFRDIRSRHGVILSMLVRPCRAEDARFRALIADILAVAGASDESHPVPAFGLFGGIDPRRVRHNARVGHRLGTSKLGTVMRTTRDFLVAGVCLGLRVDNGRFSARRYLREVVANSDFRKYDDGLMMTLDCSAAVADRLAAHLLAAQRAGVATFGLHRQASALMTCFVPSATDSRHVHFIDGAAGGYAMAAADLKSRLSLSKEL